MMWKESYKLGVEHIDMQHKELFDRTEKLLHFVKSEDCEARKQKCIEAILFLKDYAVKHFAAEEEYQQSIHYTDIEEHKAIHSSFVVSVLEAEKKLKDSDFSIESIKDFSGFLTAWLIYHVADADQKIKTGEKIFGANASVTNFYVTCFAHSMANVLETMFGRPAGSILFTREQSNDDDDIVVQIGLKGTCNGNAFFRFPRETVFAITKAMTFLEAAEIDEIAYSLIAEMSNIVSGNAATLVSESGRKCEIMIPQVLSEIGAMHFKDGFTIDTEYGKISVHIKI